MSSPTSTTPAEIARDAFKQLAARRIPPTPENYARMYAERAGKQLAEVEPAVGALEAVLAEIHADPSRASLAVEAEDGMEHSDWKAVRAALKNAFSRPAPKPADPQPDWHELLKELVSALRTDDPGRTATSKQAEAEALLASIGQREVFPRMRGMLRMWKPEPVQNGAGAPPGAAHAQKAATAQPAATASPVAAAAPRSGLTGAQPVAESARSGVTGSLPVDGSSRSELMGPPPAAGSSRSDLMGAPLPAGSSRSGLTGPQPVAGPSRSGLTGPQPVAALTAGVEPASLAPMLKSLISKVITYCVDPELGYSEKVVEQATELAATIQQAATADEVVAAASRLRHFWIDVELRREGPQHLLRSLQGLLQLLMQNLGDLVADDRWVHGQVEQIQALLAEPLTPSLIEQAERSFKDYLLRQGTLKQALDEARTALRDMMAALVSRLGTITTSTGTYTGKLTQYSERIRSARDLSEISAALSSLLSDTQNVHGDMSRTHDELRDAQERVDVQEKRMRELETQLAELSQRIGEDALTAALNRRGLEQQFSIEDARARRKKAPMCLAVLDIDNFKQLNDRLGHAAGDNALRHLVEVVRQVIRPTDSLARYGGEEFVILLPETTIDNAERVMVRLQRELTKRFFLHNNERVLITFSAGVAERWGEEPQQQLIERADAAMYSAKRAGKNRVERAE